MIQLRQLLDAIVVFVLLLTTPGPPHQRVAGQETNDTSLGFAFKVVHEDRSTIGPPTLFILVRLSEEAYTRENLDLLWHHYCQKYPDETQKLDLRISVDRKADNRTTSVRDDRPTTFQDHGFDANFLRQGDGALAGGGNNELLIYTPRLDEPTELRRVVLRGKDPFDPYAYTGNRESDFVAAAAKQDVVKLKALLGERVNINGRNQYGKTALMQASLWGDAEVVKMLLDKGADMNAKDEAGWTALICASSHGNNEIAKLLLDRGAELNVKNNIGMSALTRAIYDGRTDTFKLLLARAAEIDLQDQWGNTPLMLAAQRNHPEMLSILLDRGVDVDARNNQGETPLICVYDEHSAIALMNKGADVNTRTRDGSTALMYSIRNPRKVRALLDHGADTSIKNSEGETVLQMAEKHTDLGEVIRILREAGAKP